MNMQKSTILAVIITCNYGINSCSFSETYQTCILKDNIKLGTNLLGPFEQTSTNGKILPPPRHYVDTQEQASHNTAIYIKFAYKNCTCV